MELVAAAKMRRAQMLALASRTYSALAWELLQNLSSRAHPRLHRLLRFPSSVEKIAIVLMTSNRGLIGGFNTNLINTALNYAAGFKAASLEFITLGKKGRQVIRKRGFLIAAEFEKKDAATSVLDIRPLSKLLIEDFILQKYDKIVLVYMDFVSTLQQKPNVRELLPLVQTPDATLGEMQMASLNNAPPPPLKLRGGEGGVINSTDYLFEPSPDQVLEVLLPRLTEMQIYQAVLETNASEHSARMVAMKNATDAASDLVLDLTLEYNKMRQEAITKEMNELAAGRLAAT